MVRALTSHTFAHAEIFFAFIALLDSTYSERYMGMPNLTDNYQGYSEADLSKHVDQLKDKQFLLVRFFL